MNERRVSIPFLRFQISVKGCRVREGRAIFCRLPVDSKMAIILPTGQWYAPSAVFNVPWYCMVLHGVAWYCRVSHGIAWYCMVLNGIAWY